jgi:hypothetical protein
MSSNYTDEVNSYYCFELDNILIWYTYKYSVEKIQMFFFP